MSIEAWIAIIVVGVLFVIGVWTWWKAPDDLEGARQRERALKAMKQWTS